MLLETHLPARIALTRQIWAVWIGLAAVWWLAIRMLWIEWEIDPQYSYGFLVPILCVVLFFQRWRDRPLHGESENLFRLGMAALPTLSFLLAVQPFYEANPEWRIPGILGALSAVLLTLLLLWCIGGYAWMRHFLFPVGFFLIAIPWPRNAEEAIMGFFMEKNAMAALEILHWLGYEAVRRGHLIALPTGTLGVEEACSGVRSLQSGIMASLFLGEVFRFSRFFRSILVSISLLVALFGNFLRTTILSIIAYKEGVDAIEKWHDMAGYVILISTLVTLWLIAHFYSTIRNKRNPASATINDSPDKPLTISKPIALACISTFFLAMVSLAGTELWYRAHEAGTMSESSWTLKSGSAGTMPIQIPERTRRILFFPDGFSERFADSEGRKWQIFYLRWPAGRTAIQALNIHDPRTCLASIGMVLEKQLNSLTIQVGKESFRFRVFLFRDAGRHVLVFHSIIAGGISSEHDSYEDETISGEGDTLRGRWNVVAKGIRNRGQTLLEAAVWNTTDVTTASNTLAEFLALTMREDGLGRK
jgi:exosortase